jgi:hypothetical protein
VVSVVVSLGPVNVVVVVVGAVFESVWCTLIGACRLGKGLPWEEAAVCDKDAGKSGAEPTGSGTDAVVTVATPEGTVKQTNEPETFDQATLHTVTDAG